jgi:hypothetical protein
MKHLADFQSIANDIELEKRDMRLINAVRKMKIESEREKQLKKLRNPYAHVKSKYLEFRNQYEDDTKRGYTEREIYTKRKDYKQGEIKDYTQSKELQEKSHNSNTDDLLKRIAQLEKEYYLTTKSKDLLVNLQLEKYKKENNIQ